MTRRVPRWLLSMCIICAPQAAGAQRATINLPAGSLTTATEMLTQQTGVNIILPDRVLWKRHVPAVRGRMTPEMAVRTLARHTGARATRAGSSGWRLEAITGPRWSVPVRATAERGQDGTSRENDIVVLASKRRTLLHDFAGSVEVISPPQIGIDAGTQVLVRKSTIISSTYRGAGREKLFISGIADSGFSGRLQSVTGLYLGEVRLTYSASDPNLQLYDIASVETLQGPQGTLFGSGAMGGIIRLNPKSPQRGVAGGSVGGGLSWVVQGGRGMDADAMVNLPLTDKLALRAVAYARTEAGFIDRLGMGRDVNGNRMEGGRVTVRWWPAEGWTVDAVALAQASRSSDAQYSTIGAPRLTVLGAIPEPYGGDYAAGHLVVGGRLGSLDLMSATGTATQNFRERFALQGSFSRISDVDRQHDMTTHETRISRRHGDGTGWIAGVSYVRTHGASGYRDRILSENNFNGLSIIDTAFSSDDSVAEVALFGEGTVRVAPFLALGAGARGVQATTRGRSATSFGIDARSRRRERWLLPSASVLLNLFANLSSYVRYQQGARPGVPRLQSWTSVDEASRERVATFDAGVRWHSEGGWMARASMGRTHWRQMSFNAFEGSFGFGEGSLGDWRMTSLHAALSGPLLRGVHVDVAATVNRAKVQSRFIAGAPDIADFIARVEVSWARPLGPALVLRVNGWARYEGRSLGFHPILAPQAQGDYLRTGLFIDVDRKADRLSLSVDNPLNTRGTRYILGSLLLAGSTVTPLQPTTFRIGYQRAFGSATR